jgi:hypothetical protein
MTEKVEDPVEPVVDPAPEPTPPQPPATPPATAPRAEVPEGYIEKARYDGLVRKTEELTLSNRDLNAQLAAATSEKEQLSSQLGIKDTEKSVAVGEYQKQLEQALETNTSQASELQALRAMKSKMELVKKHNAGHLLPILDRIPYVEDEEAMEIVFTDFLKWGEDIAKNRENQLLAGYVPPAAPNIPESEPVTPQTKADWDKYIQSADDKEAAFQEYWAWGQSQTK